MPAKAPRKRAKPRRRSAVEHAVALGVSKRQLGALVFVAEMGEMMIRQLYPDGRHEDGIVLAAEALGVLCTRWAAEDAERVN